MCVRVVRDRGQGNRDLPIGPPKLSGSAWQMSNRVRVVRTLREPAGADRNVFHHQLRPFALSGAAPEGDHRLRHLLFGKFLVAYVLGKTPGEIIEPVAVDPQRIGELLHHAIR
jgi:hypothetical protein